MKAYMSVPGVRAVCCVSPIRDSQHAEAEARMLLSETEPETLYTAFRLQGPFAEDTFALQEALAAFCDDGQGARS